jgi:uncharacterized protein
MAWRTILARSRAFVAALRWTSALVLAVFALPASADPPSFTGEPVQSSGTSSLVNLRGQGAIAGTAPINVQVNAVRVGGILSPLISVVRAVLEAYAVTGVLGLARRDGNRRYYDLLERLLPKDVLERNVPLREQVRHKLLSRFRAHGLLGVGGGGDIFGGLGPAKPHPDRPEHPGRTALREELVEDGELVPVEVEHVRGKRFVLREEVDVLMAPPEPPASVAFLPPFDPLVWDRGLLGSLFDFEYVWELFFPPSKRRWGWYVLPIIFRDRFVGRIEPRIDRTAGRVEVLGLWWEDGFDPRRTDGFVDAMLAALRGYLRFADASRLEWPPHLRKEKRLFLIRA